MTDHTDIPGIGTLRPVPALDRLDLVAPPVARALTALAAQDPAPASSASTGGTAPPRRRRS